MIRSAAKNHERVAVVVDPADYAARARRDRRRRARSRRRTRFRLARKAFAHTAAYDGAIAVVPRARSTTPEAPLADFPETLHVSRHAGARAALRREPAPEGGVLRASTARRRPVAGARRGAAGQGAVVQQPARPGRGAAPRAPSSPAPAAAIIKHNNPCGVADRRRRRGRGLPPRARDRSGVGLRRHRRREPPRRRRARRASWRRPSSSA